MYQTLKKAFRLSPSQSTAYRSQSVRVILLGLRLTTPLGWLDVSSGNHPSQTTNHRESSFASAGGAETTVTYGEWRVLLFLEAEA
jgi:hypothetical protein